jgi:hypothetical protein
VAGARRRREAGALAGIRAAVAGWVGSLASGQALSSLPSRIMVIVVVAVLVLGSAGAGVVQASDESLPDSPLYQVKTAREWVETVAARDNQARMGVHIRQAGRRTIELSIAIRSGKPRPVVAILASRLDAATTRLVDDAQESKAQNNHQAVNRALTALRTIRSQVEQMSTQAPGQYRPLQRLHTSLVEKEQRLIEFQ